MVFSPLFLWELWAPTYNWLLAFWAYFEGKSPGLELGQPEVVERVGQVGGTRTLHRISLGHPDRGVESWWCQGPWHVVGDLIFWVLFVCFHLFDHLFFECFFVSSFQLFCGSLWTGVQSALAVSEGVSWSHEEWLKLRATKKNCRWSHAVWENLVGPMRSGHHPLLLTILFRNALCVRPNLNDERLVSTLGGDGNHVSNVNVTWWHHSWVEVPLSD